VESVLLRKTRKELLEKVKRRFTKIIVNMEAFEGLSYEHRELKLWTIWTLQERRNRQHLTEVFTISHEQSIMGLKDLLKLHNNKGRRGPKLQKLNKMRSLGTVGSIFFSTEWLIGVARSTSRYCT